MNQKMKDTLAAVAISLLIGMAFNALTVSAGTILTSNQTTAAVTQNGDVNVKVSSGNVGQTGTYSVAVTSGNVGQTGTLAVSFSSGTASVGQTGTLAVSFSSGVASVGQTGTLSVNFTSGTANMGQTGTLAVSFTSGTATVSESQTTTLVHSSGSAATTNLVALSSLSTRKSFTIQNQGTNNIFVSYDAGVSTPTNTGILVAPNSSLTENRYTGAVTVETSAGTSKFVVLDLQ